MATVIDNLVVKLGLDTTDFVAGEKKVASGLEDTKKSTEKVGKNIAADGKKGAEFFGQLEKAALKFFAVLTAGRGLADFTRTVVGTGAQLDRMSKVFGTSADRLSRWQGAVRQSGGTADGFVGTMQGLSSALTELKLTGNTGILPYLQALKVAVADANGKARPLEDIISDIGDKLVKLPSKADAFNIGKNLGFDEGTINLLLKGRTEVNRLLNAQKGYSDADAEAARKASENWEGAQLRLERTTQLLVIKLIPAFEKLTKAATDLADTSVPVLSEIYDWLVKVDGITSRWAKNIDDLLPKFQNPTLQKFFGGTTSKLITGNPLVVGAGAGEAARSQLSPGARGTIDHARDELIAFFGGKVAQKRLQNPSNYSSGGGGLLDFFKLAKPGSESPGQSPSQPGLSRAQRNNNPGNLEFRGQNGAVPEDGSGRFAKFGSAAEGVSALVKQLQRYGARGLDSLDKIIAKYAPPGENDTQAYIDVLSKKLGVAPSEKLDLTNPDTLKTLVKGISKHEAGVDFLSNKDVMTGINMAAPTSNSGGGNTSIGEIKVYTQAQDANGIARDIKGAMIRQADTAIR